MQHNDHQTLIGLIWNIANKLRGPYRPHRWHALGVGRIHQKPEPRRPYRTVRPGIQLALCCPDLLIKDEPIDNHIYGDILGVISQQTGNRPRVV